MIRLISNISKYFFSFYTKTFILDVFLSWKLLSSLRGQNFKRKLMLSILCHKNISLSFWYSLEQAIFWKSLIFFILRNYLDDEGSLAYILLPNSTSWLIETLASWLTDLLGYLALNWHEFYPNKSPARLVSNIDLRIAIMFTEIMKFSKKKVTCFPNLQLKKYVQTVY